MDGGFFNASMLFVSRMKAGRAKDFGHDRIRYMSSAPPLKKSRCKGIAK